MPRLKRKTKKKEDEGEGNFDYFTTVGRVRGRCNHRHTLLNAAMCLAADAFYCVGKGLSAHTDREIIGVKGSVDHRLTHTQLTILNRAKDDDAE